MIANEKLLGSGPGIFLNSAVAVVAYKPLAHVQGIKMKVLVLHVLYTDDNDRPSTLCARAAPPRPPARPTMYVARDGAAYRSTTGGTLSLGDTAGEVVGLTVGEVVGLVVGEVVGLRVGDTVGEVVGLVVGDTVGKVVAGEVVGLTVGEVVGLVVGDTVGEVVGLAVGEVVGLVVGEVVGLRVGDTEVGEVVGMSDGLAAGLVVGESVRHVNVWALDCQPPATDANAAVHALLVTSTA